MTDRRPAPSAAAPSATTPSAPAPSATALAALLGVMGAAHFVVPGPFDTIVPRALPGRARTWTYLSGAAELAVAAALINPRTRRTGGRLAAGLFLAVLPANVQMALDWQGKAPALRAAAWARLPLQAPLIARSLRIARG